MVFTNSEETKVKMMDGRTVKTTELWGGGPVGAAEAFPVSGERDMLKLNTSLKVWVDVNRGRA